MAKWTGDYPQVECPRHGWQDTVLQTRYDRKARPRDQPDFFLCWECGKEKVPADQRNSIRVGYVPEGLEDE